MFSQTLTQVPTPGPVISHKSSEDQEGATVAGRRRFEKVSGRQHSKKRSYPQTNQRISPSFPQPRRGSFLGSSLPVPWKASEMVPGGEDKEHEQEQEHE